MKLQNSILKGLLASTGLLLAGGAFATTTYSDHPRNDARFDGSKCGLVEIGQFTKADIVNAIAILKSNLPEKPASSTDAQPQQTAWLWFGWGRGDIWKKTLPYPPATPTPTTSVPEPATLALFGIGLTGIGIVKRRRKDKNKTSPSV